MIVVVSGQRRGSVVKFGLGEESATAQDMFECGQPSLTVVPALAAPTTLRNLITQQYLWWTGCRAVMRAGHIQPPSSPAVGDHPFEPRNVTEAHTMGSNGNGDED